MARNRVQHQSGLSMAEFNRLYGSEEACHAALVRMRWPNGFACTACGGARHSYARKRRVFQCSACREQTTVKAGTIFHKSKTPLTKWFLAIHLLTCSKNDIAALELARQLDVKWDTAWLIKQKLMEAMRQRNSIYRLEGNVQVDDAYLGGERPRKPGKSGRGAEGKIPFVAAVAIRDGKPVHAQFRRVPAFTKEAVRDWAKAGVAPGSYAFSDGLSCFLGLAEAGLKHVPVVTGGGRPVDPIFKWVNIGLGNIKSAITGTCRSLDTRHADRYLAAYEWRYNRRFDLAKNLERLARVAAHTAPVPHRTIAAVRRPRLAEMSG
jgi:hypothetical protein